jgi:galactokinase
LVAINKLPLSGVALADLCGRAEWYVGTRGGVMDQFIAILAENGHALFLDCRPTGDGAEYRYRHVPVPSGYAVVVIDSGVRHQNTGPHFNLRVAEGRIGVHLLKSRYPGITHLRDVQDVPWNELEHLLPETIDREGLRAAGIDLDEVLGGGILPDAAEFRVRRRCRHVLSENYRVLEAVAAMEANDISRFGHLLRQAHASARDDYEISTPEIETLIFVAQEIPGVIGARLTGAGWGGCVVALVAQESLPTLTERVTIPYHRRTGREATVFVCRSAAGAGAVR